MQYELIDMLIRLINLNDDSGVIKSLVYATYWTKDEILSGDFSQLAYGIIDVNVSFLNKKKQQVFTEIHLFSDVGHICI